MGNWMMFWMMAPFAILIVGIIVAIVFAIAWAVHRANQPAPPAETPLAILVRRYARGEISREQLEEMKRYLSDNLEKR